MWRRLEQWQNNVESKMTREKYFDICEKIGVEPEPHKIPPELEDFPIDVQHAIMTFGKLGDRIVSEVGYLGKDYGAVPLYIDCLDVKDKELFLETIVRLDQKVIEKSAEAMKRERDKLKNKNGK